MAAFMAGTVQAPLSRQGAVVSVAAILIVTASAFIRSVLAAPRRTMDRSSLSVSKRTPRLQFQISGASRPSG
jgi:hypothetical protein